MSLLTTVEAGTGETLSSNCLSRLNNGESNLVDFISQISGFDCCLAVSHVIMTLENLMDVCQCEAWRLSFEMSLF
jgi:hypothetical protein